jgi:hypothetical protein
VGRTYHFECPRCLYRTRVSGSPDSGINCETATIVCHDCRHLYDVFTRLRLRNQGDCGERKKRAIEMRPPELVIPPLALRENPVRVFQPGYRASMKPVESKWILVKLRCPMAAYHRVEPWQDPGRCPKCGTLLDKNAFPYRMWE